MKWTESETIKLIELYRDYECLWNKTNINYKNKPMRTAASEDIIKTMAKPNFGAAELRQKIKNLRGTYNQECAKIEKSKKSGCPTVAVYVPTLKWFELMDSFMKDVKSPGVVQENIANKENHQVPMQGNNDGIEYQSFEPPRHQPPSKEQLLPKPRSTKRKLSILTSAVQELRSAQNYLCNNDPVDGENEAFGQYVTAVLNKIPGTQAVLAQAGIQSILTKYRLAAISTPDNTQETLSFTQESDVIEMQRSYENYEIHNSSSDHINEILINDFDNSPDTSPNHLDEVIADVHPATQARCS